MDSGHDGLTPGIEGFRYEDLYSPAGLKRLDRCFVGELEELKPELYTDYQNYRTSHGNDLEPIAISELLVQLAPIVGSFVARLFGVTAEHDRQREAVKRELDSIFLFRTEIVGKLAKHFKGDDPANWDRAAIESAYSALIDSGFPSLADDEDPERRTAATAAQLWRIANAPDSSAATATATATSVVWPVFDAACRRTAALPMRSPTY